MVYQQDNNKIFFSFIKEYQGEMRIVNNSYSTERLCYVYGVGMFFLVYFGKASWLVASLLSLSLFYSVYLYFYLRHVRQAVQEVRYTSQDFSQWLDRFLVEIKGNPPECGDCVVCMEPFSPDHGPYTLSCPCKHNYYHQPCVRQWLLKSATCPMCRADLKSKSFHGTHHRGILVEDGDTIPHDHLVDTFPGDLVGIHL